MSDGPRVTGNACAPEGAAATGEDAAVAVAAEVPLHIPELLELDDSDLSAEVPFELLARSVPRQRLSR